MCAWRFARDSLAGVRRGTRSGVAVHPNQRGKRQQQPVLTGRKIDDKIGQAGLASVSSAWNPQVESCPHVRDTEPFSSVISGSREPHPAQGSNENRDLSGQESLGRGERFSRRRRASVRRAGDEPPANVVLARGSVDEDERDLGRDVESKATGTIPSWARICEPTYEDLHPGRGRCEFARSRASARYRYRDRRGAESTSRTWRGARREMGSSRTEVFRRGA